VEIRLQLSGRNGRRSSEKLWPVRSARPVGNRMCVRNWLNKRKLLRRVRELSVSLVHGKGNCFADGRDTTLQRHVLNVRVSARCR
jgi:hypothetical protein